MNIVIVLLVHAGGGRRMSIATWVKKKILLHELLWKCQGYQTVLAFLGFHFLVHSFHLDLCIYLFSIGHWVLFLLFQMCVGHIRFAEGTAVMNVLNQSEWTGSGSFLTRFHPMAEVNVWEAYFLSNHWQVCKIFPLQLWADEAKYTFY